MNERVIKVNGTGKISVDPDQTILIFTLKDVAETYEKAVQMSAKQTELLQNCLLSLQFKKSDLKTSFFHVNTNFSEKTTGKKKIVDYSFTHCMKLVFDRDGERLSQILEAVSDCGGKPTFQVQYTLKDPEKAKEQLIQKAVADSKRKAEILAAAANVTLGEIIEVSYSWNEIEVYSRPMTRGLEAAAFFSDERSVNARQTFDMEPEEITLTDTVKVIWAIS